jgi:ABC-type transport system involved in multi-copper enzyme maturation permease subunit
LFGVAAYLIWHELKRNLRPVRVIPLLGLGMVMSYLEVSPNWQADEAQVQGALTLHGHWLFWVIPLVAGAMGSSLAEDRRRGFSLTVLTKGVSRGQYLLSKILGAAASGGLTTLAEISGFYLMVGIMWPAGRATWEGNESNPGPVPTLYRLDPLSHDLLVALMSIAASAALPLVGVLAGTLVINEYIAMVAPPLFVILGTVVFGSALKPLSPTVYLNVWGDYTGTIPEGLRPYAAFLYWLSLGALTAALCKWIFAKKELT